MLLLYNTTNSIDRGLGQGDWKERDHEDWSWSSENKERPKRIDMHTLRERSREAQRLHDELDTLGPGAGRVKAYDEYVKETGLRGWHPLMDLIGGSSMVGMASTV